MNIPLSTYFGLLRAYLRSQRAWVLLLGLLLLSSIGLQLLSPQFIRTFIDQVQQGAAQMLLIQTALLFVAVALLERVAAVATTYVSQSVAWRATNGLRRDLARHVLKLDMGFHNAHTPGELLERIDGDVDRLANFFSEFLLEILNGLLLAVGVLVLLGREDWRLGVLLTGFVLAYLVVHTRGQQLAAPRMAKERDYAAELMGFVEERLAGVRDLQTSGAAPYTMRRFYEQVRRHTWQALKADVVTDIGWTISKIFYDLGTVAGMALGAYLFLTGTITLGTVYLVVSYIAVLNGPLNRIARQLEDLQQARVAIARVQSLLSTAPRISDQGGGSLAPGRALALTFDHITFGYQPDKPILRDISFELAAGHKLGLLGRTGSGKSSLARLVFRLYDVDAGCIRLDGTDIRQLQLAALRRRIGLVTQEVQLFPASLRDNLTLFDATIPDDAIWASLQRLGLDAWVRGLPAALDTPLTGDGDGLSAGEAQLLALGRVFLKDPGLVILDEASSRLDPATERLLEQALDGLLQGRTAIIIAHRLATVRRADQIMILAGGEVQETGAYQDLANDPRTRFARLLRAAELADAVSADDAAQAEWQVAKDNLQPIPQEVAA